MSTERKTHSAVVRPVSDLQVNQVAVFPETKRPERVVALGTVGDDQWLVETDHNAYWLDGDTLVKVFTGGWRGDAHEVAARVAALR